MKQFYLILSLGLLCLCQAIAQPISVATLNVQYQQDFNTLSTTSPSSILPAGWFLIETGTGTLANGQYGVSTGSSNSGDAYSFGLAGSTERALGSLRSGSVLPLIGAGFTNTSGSVITALQISYRGEQWRLGAVRANDRMDFQISFDATSINNGTWTHVDELDFIAPVNSGTVGLLNGNTNSSLVAFEIPGLSIANGQTFFIRWTDFDASGADDGLAVDDFSLTPIGVAIEPSLSFSPATLSFGDVNAGSSKVLSYEVTATNIEDHITVSSANELVEVSSDNISFSQSLTIPSSGGIVYVKFSPLVNGAVSTAIVHSSGTYSKALPVSGFGFVQAENIISIAQARTKSSGTKVTVAGRVTVANEHGNPAFIQDATGGIPVFFAALASSVSIGDSVIVTGPIGVFNDQKQISGSGIFYTQVPATPRIPEPKPITLSQMAAHEGLLVKITGVALVNKSFVFYPQSTEQLTDGVVVADLRIDGDTDIPGLAKPQTPFDVVGVVGRFRTNAQLLPRSNEDMPAAVEPSTPGDGISKTLTFDVVNWNFEFFGARSEDYGNEEYGPADEALQLQNIKSVLLSLNADIIAVQEVSDEAYLGELVSQLTKYDYICSQRFSYSFQGPSNEFPPQKVCFVYDKSTVAIESARPMFEALYDQARTSNPAALPGYPTGDPSSFYSSGRLPFLINAKATIQGVSEQISFVVLHSKSGSTVADFNRRVYDAQVLKDSLDAHFTDKQVIILGDLNDDLDQSIVSGKPSSYLNLVNDDSYNSITKPLSEAGARSTVSFQDVIDHQIITTELNEEYMEGSATIIAPFRSVRNYATTTSDHLPVISRYQFIAPVVSFATADKTVSEESGTHQITLTTSRPSLDDLSVTISLDGSAQFGADFTSAASNPLVVVIPAGQTTATFDVTIVDDQLDELLETIELAISPAMGIEVGVGNITVNVEDNDVPVVSFERGYTSVEEGKSTTIVVKLSTAVATDQLITVRVDDSKKADYGVDYTLEPAPGDNEITIVVPAGNDEVALTLSALVDKRREVIQLVSLRISEVSDGLLLSTPIPTVVAIEDVRKKPVFTLYPNPTYDFVQLVADDFDADEQLRVVITEPNGNVVLTAEGTLAQLNSTIHAALVNRRKGLYNVNVFSGDETVMLRVLKL